MILCISLMKKTRQSLQSNSWPAVVCWTTQRAQTQSFLEKVNEVFNSTEVLWLEELPDLSPALDFQSLLVSYTKILCKIPQGGRIFLYY